MTPRTSFDRTCPGSLSSNWPRLVIATCFSLAFLAISGCFWRNEAPVQKSESQTSVDSSALSDFKAVKATELKQVVLSAKNKKAILVNVWATWCEPCKVEMPSLLQFQKETSSKGFELILVSADSKESRAEAKKFLSDLGVDFPSYILGESPDVFVKAWEPRWSATLPASFLFDGSGRLKTFWVGETSRKDLTNKVSPLLR